LLAELSGETRSLLAAERTALNLLGHLCGVATRTRDVVAAVEKWRTRVAGTRKTLPLLRALQKYAVRVGGGSDHRFGLDDAVLIKDNHRAVAGGAVEAVRRARRALGHLFKIEVEVEDLDELRAVLDQGVDAVLFDNMAPERLAEAVRIVDQRAVTEASGGITPATAPSYAATGVDVLSLGWLTHSVANLDVAFDLEGRADPP
jgi:nicotinate-nucleotide pyrophosphorylase (carboxylating)